MNSPTRLAVIVGVFTLGLVGWSAAGYVGAAIGLAIGVITGVVRLRGRQPWSWLMLWLGRRRPIVLVEPITVVNDRAGGGVRCQDGVAAVAVQVLGKPHAATLFTGATSTYTENTVDVGALLPLLRQSLGLTVESLSLVSVGSRRRSTGDYPRVYDTLIGTPAYAGRRETWLIVRIAVLANVEALWSRTSAGTAALAAAQRIGAALRQQGIRTRVATATDITEMERRLGNDALDAAHRRWRSLRGEAGWLTTYWYHPDDIATAPLAQAWTLPADGIIQNVTVSNDGSTTATVTVRTAQPPTAPPSVLLRKLPGEQAVAIAANLCGPRPTLRGIERGVPSGALIIPVGPSGVLLGKTETGNRVLLPLDDPGEASRVYLAAEDSLVKRLVVRLAASGDRITVHTHDLQRWDSVRMPDVFVSDAARPVAGTTVSITDGTVTPAPRPNTVISVGDLGAPHRGSADVLVRQTGPVALEVTAGGLVHSVEVELFRAENRYAAAEPITPTAPLLEPVD